MGISEHLRVWSVGICPYSAWWCWWQGENRRNVCGRDKTTVALPVSAEGMAHALCCTVQTERQPPCEPSLHHPPAASAAGCCLPVHIPKCAQGQVKTSGSICLFAYMCVFSCLGSEPGLDTCQASALFLSYTLVIAVILPHLIWGYWLYLIEARRFFVIPGTIKRSHLTFQTLQWARSGTGALFISEKCRQRNPDLQVHRAQCCLGIRSDRADPCLTHLSCCIVTVELCAQTVCTPPVIGAQKEAHSSTVKTYTLGFRSCKL